MEENYILGICISFVNQNYQLELLLCWIWNNDYMKIVMYDFHNEGIIVHLNANVFFSFKERFQGVTWSAAGLLSWFFLYLGWNLILRSLTWLNYLHHSRLRYLVFGSSKFLGDFPMDCPLQDSLLRVHYKGMLLNKEKTVFYDTKVDNHGQPLEFCSGEGLVSLLTLQVLTP